VSIILLSFMDQGRLDHSEDIQSSKPDTIFTLELYSSE
jgi:hypothetical protein